MDDPKKNPSFHHGDAVVASLPDGQFMFPFAPRGLEILKFRVEKEDYVMSDSEIPASQELSQIKLVLKNGVAIAGTVTSEEGVPIVGATVRELSNYGSEPPKNVTDAAGAFILRGVSNHYPDRALRVIVQAENFRPEIRDVQPSGPTNWIHFKLSKGIRFYGRVVDESGAPIAGAVVRTDSGSDGLDPYHWLTHTDAEGRFEWNSAPSEQALFWFEAPGYSVLRDVPITPDNLPKEIRLNP